MKLVHTWLRVISRDIGEIKEQFAPTEIHQVITKAVEGTETHATRKDITLQTAFQEALSPVFGDEGTLVEAVMNLINNAVKYSRMGSQVDIQVGEEHGEVSITVADTGIGISAEDLPFVFDDFYAGKAATGEKKGSGLGLALTRRIVEAHGGEIVVVSEFGQGSAFTIRLPACKTNVEEKEAIGMATYQGGPDGVP
jgi:signal transduction histidine kinase